MGARATDVLEYTTFPGMTYQVGLGPASVVSGTAAANTTVICRIDKGGAINTATFEYSINGGTTWLDQDTLCAGSNSIGATGLTMTWGAGSDLVLGATYTWTNIPIVLNGCLTTSDPELLRLDVMDAETIASLVVTTKRSGTAQRTVNIVEGDKLELNISTIVSAVGVNKAWAFWGEF
jgi:hypothetical protein